MSNTTPLPTDECELCGKPFAQHHSIDMDQNGPYAYVCDNASGSEFTPKKPSTPKEEPGKDIKWYTTKSPKT